MSMVERGPESADANLKNERGYDRQLCPWNIRTADPDLLSKWQIICIAETHSTNDIARRIVNHRRNSLLAIFAEWQSAGRGQAGRPWIVPPGRGLLCTTLWYPPISPADLHVMVQIAGVAVVGAFASFGIHVRLKWPNDIMIDGAKCGGILVESVIEGTELRFVAIGIGLNVLQSVEELPPVTYPATSIRLRIGRVISRAQLAARLLRQLEFWNDSLRGDRFALFAGWNEALETIGEGVHISTTEGIVSGIAVRACLNGALVVRTADGREISILNGEVLSESTSKQTSYE